MSGGEGGKWLDRRWRSENATIGKPDLLVVGTQSNECNSLSHFLNINNVAEHDTCWDQSWHIRRGGLKVYLLFQLVLIDAEGIREMVFEHYATTKLLLGGGRVCLQKCCDFGVYGEDTSKTVLSWWRPTFWIIPFKALGRKSIIFITTETAEKTLNFDSKNSLQQRCRGRSRSNGIFKIKLRVKQWRLAKLGERPSFAKIKVETFVIQDDSTCLLSTTTALTSTLQCL